MSKQTHVKLRHPQTGGEWACPVGAVAAWTAKGWKRADETTDAAKAAPAKKKEQQ